MASRKHVMTPARRTALRKAQLASAAKRHGMKISNRPNAVIVGASIYPVKRISANRKRSRRKLTKAQKAQLVHSAANLAGIAVGTAVAVRMNRQALTGVNPKRLRYGNYVKSTRGFRAGPKMIGK